MSQPFIIYALPRSRTAWLSVFLSYKKWECYHEIAVCMRDFDDVKRFFSREYTGLCETAAAQGRPLIKHVAPNIKEVVILRPIDEVVKSVVAMGEGVVTYDVPQLCKSMAYGGRLLRKIAEDKNVLTVNCEDLDKEETCSAIFEHCLPYKFDKEWWESLRNENVQADVKGLLTYYHSNISAITDFKRRCKSELRRLVYAGEIPRKVIV